MAVDVLKSRGVPEDRILFVNLIASPEGINVFAKKFPKLRVVTAFIDQVCNSRESKHSVFANQGVYFRDWTKRSKFELSHPLRICSCADLCSYIVPGLGDFGDRF